MSHALAPARAVADKARQVIAKVRPGATEGRRSLPIRSSEEEIRGRWATALDEILDGIPVAGATLDVGDEDRDWGRTVTLHLEVSAPVPGMATQALEIGRASCRERV